MKPVLFIGLLLVGFTSTAQYSLHTDVLIAGGGTGGTAAGIQSARSGAATVIVEGTPWLGGMLSAAGVTATDGNNNLPSGLWQEFRKRLYDVYGGPAAVFTGWVSNTQFEPHVADSVLKRMAASEKKLKVFFDYRFTRVLKKGDMVTGAVFTGKGGQTLTVHAAITIDATELGDVLADAGAACDIGMEAASITHENAGVTVSSPIIQDLTYTAVLKDYGPGSDHTIPRPEGYDPAEFDCACTNYCIDSLHRRKPKVDAARMLDYGRLPNGKYMINWPLYGNDTYLDVIRMKDSAREQALEAAKLETLRFIYFIQHQLGFPNLGLANDEYPTRDRLPFIPYYREGRRVKGVVRFTMNNIEKPYTYGDPLYRTGIAVGDYPIDHHHTKNPEAPQHLHFYPIPSFSIPAGVLVPVSTGGLIVAEKGISVSNVVNGTTRLEPVVLLTGQAAGAMAALCVKGRLSPAQLPVRSLQTALLEAGAYLQPYIDVRPENPHFKAIQRIGATGILKGKGVPFDWANQTWFYPDSLCTPAALVSGLKEYAAGWKMDMLVPEGRYVTPEELARLIAKVRQAAVPAGRTTPANTPAGKAAPANRPPAQAKAGDYSSAGVLGRMQAQWQTWGLRSFRKDRYLTRAEVAVALDAIVDPFDGRAVDYRGYFQ
jgi:hypothetical protein